MNTTPLTANHGAPVRIIAPGIAGARCVKWLERITVQSTESENFYQKRDYKILPPEATNKKEAENYWDLVTAVQDMPINSVIGSPQNGETVKIAADGVIEVRGYALPQGADGPVTKVEVSGDEGKTWTAAEFIGERSKWSWALWRVRIRMRIGDKQRIFCRATDKGGNVQCANPQWNFRGVAWVWGVEKSDHFSMKTPQNQLVLGLVEKKLNGDKNQSRRPAIEWQGAWKES